MFQCSLLGNKRTLWQTFMRPDPNAMNSAPFPTPWQRKTIWSALTALAIVTIGSISVGIIWLAMLVLGFLQPILIPFAVAGVLAYLLEPVVPSWQSGEFPAKPPF